jgi:hypothetical protein
MLVPLEKALIDKRTEHLSPSGKYRLVITPFETKPNCWDYTQGLVYRVGSDSPIAEVQRNYSHFPFLWVENHPNGHDYLVTGQDYQGQTVIELDTGKRKDCLSDGAEEGYGFCWAAYEFNASSQILVVSGCIWACPYEYRFYDFSDPMEGWPEIVSDTCIDDWEKWPTVVPDGTIHCYQPRMTEDGDPADEIAAIQTFKREGLKLVLVSEWVSEDEQKRRIKHAQAMKEYNERLATFRSSDPLYLACQELLKDPSLTPDNHEGIGITYPGWCPFFEGKEQRMCHRIIQGGNYTVDLEWAMVSGPIKLVIYKDGSHFEDKFFGHSVGGMHEAFEYAKRLQH